jgi:hypothetical protein
MGALAVKPRSVHFSLTARAGPMRQSTEMVSDLPGRRGGKGKPGAGKTVLGPPLPDLREIGSPAAGAYSPP